MKGTLQENDVTKNSGETRQGWIAFNTPAAKGEEHKGEVRPRRLIRQPLGEILEISGAEGLVSDDCKTRTPRNLTQERRHIGADR